MSLSERSRSAISQKLSAAVDEESIEEMRSHCTVIGAVGPMTSSAVTAIASTT